MQAAQHGDHDAAEAEVSGHTLHQTAGIAADLHGAGQAAERAADEHCQKEVPALVDAAVRRRLLAAAQRPQMVAEAGAADHHGVYRRQHQRDHHAQIDTGALIELGQHGDDLGGLGLRAAAEGIEHHIADELLRDVVQHQRHHDLAGVELHAEEARHGGPYSAQHDAQQDAQQQQPRAQLVAGRRYADQGHAQRAHQHLSLAAQIAELGMEGKGDAQPHQQQRCKVHGDLTQRGDRGQGADQHIVIGLQRVGVDCQDQQRAHQHGAHHA